MEEREQKGRHRQSAKITPLVFRIPENLKPDQHRSCVAGPIENRCRGRKSIDRRSRAKLQQRPQHRAAKRNQNRVEMNPRGIDRGYGQPDGGETENANLGNRRRPEVWFPHDRDSRDRDRKKSNCRSSFQCCETHFAGIGGANREVTSRSCTVPFHLTVADVLLYTSINLAFSCWPDEKASVPLTQS